MLDELRLLADAVDKISVEQATQVVDAVNRRLAAALRSTVIRVYWRSESELGAIFTPVTQTIPDDKYSEPQQFELSGEPSGLLSWVFHEKKDLWVTDIQSHIADKKPIENKAAKSALIPVEYLWFRYPNDCAFVFPFVIKGQVRGIYSIEADSTEKDRFNSQDAYEYLSQVRQNLGLIIDRAFDTESELAKRRRGVRRFLDKIRGFEIPPEIFLPKEKTCFIATPYKDSNCKKASDLIVKSLEGVSRVRASIYSPDEEIYMIDGIMKQIEDSHFCIANITDLNPNVMLELGMMMIIGKPVVIIKDREDKLNFPFDINNRPVFSYELDHDADTMAFSQSGKKAALALDEFLAERIKIISTEDDSLFLAKNIQDDGETKND